MKNSLKKLLLINCITLCIFLHATEFHYYSQWGQDTYIHQQFFPNKKDGIYIEIGAHDGIQFSNTFFFEQLGWSGMCIEPIAEIFEKLRTNRNEKCICIQGAISDSNGQAPFLYIKGFNDTLSGLINKYDPRHVRRINIEGHINNCEFITRTVECFHLNDLLEKYGMHHIDYLSIDIEGGELDVLRSIDYTKVDIDVITVEDNYQNPEIRIFLEAQGFIFITTLTIDLVFRNKKYLNPMQQDTK